MNDQQPGEAWPSRPTLPPPPGHGPSPASGAPPPPLPSAPFGAGSTTIGAHAPVHPLQTNLGLGIVFGLVAALVGGAVWYGIVVASDRQFVYLAIGFGVLVGAAVVKGARRANPATAVVAAVIAALGIVMSYYFIYRHAIIEALEDEGLGDIGVPLFGSFTQIKDFVQFSFEEQASQYLFAAAAVIAAAFVGAKNR